MTILDKIREFVYARSYTCDACGAELFDYYPRRLCDSCLQALPQNDKGVCPKCGRQTQAQGVCLACKSHMPKFVKGCSPFVYRGDGALHINRMKNGVRRLAFFFGERMAEYFLDRWKAWKQLDRYALNAQSTVIIPIPIAKEKRKERGYNQAEELAYAFSKTLAKKGMDIPIVKNAVILNRATLSQKELDKTGRKSNVDGAFHITKRTAVQGKIVILIDDIMTTGATGSSCAHALLRAKAKMVLFCTATSLPERVD